MFYNLKSSLGGASAPSNPEGNKEPQLCSGLTGGYEYVESLEWDPKGAPFKFSSVYPRLPVDAAPGHPRIIDIESFVKARNFDLLCAPDMVVTVLYNYNEKVLDAFLNTKGNDVKFRRHEPPVHYHSRDGKGKTVANDFFVERKGSVLSFGYVEDELYKYWITDSGKWGALSYEIPGGIIYTKLPQIEKHGLKLAADGLELEWWKEVDGVTIEVVGVDLAKDSVN